VSDSEGRAAARAEMLRRDLSQAEHEIREAMTAWGWPSGPRHDSLHRWAMTVREAIDLLSECDRRARAVEALTMQWREKAQQAHGLAIKHHGDDAGNTHAFLKERRIWNTCADELEAALASPAPAAEDGRT
jgi:hypothetical protein